MDTFKWNPAEILISGAALGEFGFGAFGDELGTLLMEDGDELAQGKVITRRLQRWNGSVIRLEADPATGRIMVETENVVA